MVARKCQTTIHDRLHTKHHVKEETRLGVVETKEDILFKPKRSTLDLAGSGAKHSTTEEMKRALDKLREEDVQDSMRHQILH